MGTYSSDLENQLLSLLAKLESSVGNGYSGINGNGISTYYDVDSNRLPLDQRQQRAGGRCGLASMLAEVRTLDLWRAVIGECLAAVFYVLLVCGASSPWVGGQPTPPERHLVVSMVSGFSMTVLVHCFHQVSGGHVNPAITLALAAMRRVSPLRALMFILAQLGGGIAGAALLFGATSSGYGGSLGATAVSRTITPGQAFAVEFLLSFVVVLAYFSAMCPHRAPQGGQPALIVGLAYLATTLVGLPLTGASMNPARSLGPAFVMNNWDAHWVYWAGPLLGGITAAFIHEFIFNPRRSPLSRNQSSEAGDGGDCSSDTLGGGGSPHGEDEDGPSLREGGPSTATQQGGGGPHQYNPLRRLAARSTATTAASGGNRRRHHTPAGELYTPESEYGGYDDYIYSGSKSLYTPAPRPTNLHRSQSVYTRPLPAPNTGTSDPDSGAVTPQNAQQDHKPPTPAGGLLHNNLMVYNAQQKQQYQQQQQQQQPNNINKPVSVSGPASAYAKNIAPSESEYSSSSSRRTPVKSNLIKPEPIYKTAHSANNQHHHQQHNNNQNLLHHHQQQQQLLHHQQQQQQQQHLQQQQYQTNPNLHSTQTAFQPTTTNISSSSNNSNINSRRGGATNHSSHSSSTSNERAPSVLSAVGPPNPHLLKCHSGEDDDSSLYGGSNYHRGYPGRNRLESATPGAGSLHSDMTMAGPNGGVSYPQSLYGGGQQGDKLY